MSSSFDLPAVDRFVVGTIGMPGDRTIYLQAVIGREVRSFRCEKAQVAALVNALGQLVSELSPPKPDPPEFVGLDLPLIEEWIVGVIGLAYDGDADLVVLVLEEIQRTPNETGAKAQIRLSRQQVMGIAVHGERLVSAGRPTCLYCGTAIDPEGYNCSCYN